MLTSSNRVQKTELAAIVRNVPRSCRSTNLSPTVRVHVDVLRDAFLGDPAQGSQRDRSDLRRDCGAKPPILCSTVLGISRPDRSWPGRGEKGLRHPSSRGVEFDVGTVVSCPRPGSDPGQGALHFMMLRILTSVTDRRGWRWTTSRVTHGLQDKTCCCAGVSLNGPGCPLEITETLWIPAQLGHRRALVLAVGHLEGEGPLQAPRSRLELDEASAIRANEPREVRDAVEPDLAMAG